MNALRSMRFVAIMLAGLTLGLSFCHLMQLPSRMGWDQYLWVGSTVQGGLYATFGSVGAVIFVATVIALTLLAYFVREHGRPGFRLALAAAIFFALALVLLWARGHGPPGLRLGLAAAIFFAVAVVLWWVLVYPGNVDLTLLANSTLTG